MLKEIDTATQELASFILNRRISLSMTAKEFAQQLGVSKQHVYCLEHGRVKLLKNDRLRYVAHVLKIKSSVLVKIRNKQKKNRFGRREHGCGSALARRRVELGISLKELAKKTGLGIATVGRLERNLKTNQRQRTTLLVNAALGLSPSLPEVIAEKSEEAKQILVKWEQEGMAVKDWHLDRSIEELELSVRSYNCMKRAPIQTIGELRNRTESDLLALKNFGGKSLREIKEVLAYLGLSLKPE